MAETAQLTVQLDLKGNLTSGITKAQRSLGNLQKSVGKVGTGVGQIGTGFARAGLFVGGAAVAGLGAAAKAAIDFEDAFAGVRKTVDEADLAAAGISFESLATTFRDMATEIPIAATEFARLGETAGALGVAAGDIDEFVRTTALLGVTTDLTADQAADSLGRIGTILQFTGQDYEDFADSLVALGNAGASTESEIIEITKRFAAEGEAAGLATEDIAGLASATASLGFAPERGGTALARVFANMGTNIALANKKGKEFSSVTGRSIKDLQSSLDKGEGLGIFLDVLESIKGMSATEANRTLKALGVTNTSDRTIFRAMSDNLPFVTEQLEIAADATGALSEEATKRFDTIASKIQLLKNNLVEAGITLGEGFAPAIGRAAEKLSAFLRQDGNRAELTKLGEEIGEAIDGIDWAEVLDGARDFVDVMKTALGFAKRIFDTFNALPTELKGAVAGLLVANKLSGGLVAAGAGNIISGLGGAALQGAASRAPGVGRLFAQPVFVTNWPLGGVGGGAGGVGAAAGAGGAVGFLQKAIPIAAIVASVAAVVQTQQEQSSNNSATASGIQQTQKVFLAQNPTTESLRNALNGVDQGIADLRSNPLHMLVQGDALSKLQQMRADLITQLNKLDANKAAQLETKRETARGSGIVKSQTQTSGVLVANQTRSSGAGIEAAIRASRPIITVSVSSTNITKVTTRTERNGPTNGTRNRDSDGSGTLGNGGP